MPTRLPKHFARVLMAAVLLATLAGAAVPDENARPIVLRCGRLLDVRAGTLWRDQVVLIAGNKIVAVGPPGSPPP